MQHAATILKMDLKTEYFSAGFEYQIRYQLKGRTRVSLQMTISVQRSATKIKKKIEKT